MAGLVKPAGDDLGRDRLETLVNDVRTIILTGRSSAIRSVDRHRVATYWNVGQRLVEEEQEGQDRAPYGASLIENLAQRIEPEFGSDFSARRLRSARQFYRTYPIWNAMRSELNWTQYRPVTRNRSWLWLVGSGCLSGPRRLSRTHRCREAPLVGHGSACCIMSARRTVGSGHGRARRTP